MAPQPPMVGRGRGVAPARQESSEEEDEEYDTMDVPGTPVAARAQVGRYDSEEAVEDDEYDTMDVEGEEEEDDLYDTMDAAPSPPVGRGRARVRPSLS